MKHISFHQDGRRAGSALILAVISVVLLLGMAAALLRVGMASKKEHLSATDRMKSLYIAEAGLAQGVTSAMAGAVPPIGTSAAPITFSNGNYWGTTQVDATNHTTTITVYGTSRGSTRGMEAVVKQTSDGIYANAVFAGNSTGDAAYQMRFGGTSTQADLVNGNIYSGGNIAISGTARINGTARAAGSISGGTGETGYTQRSPNLAAMDYEHHNDVNVAAQFGGGTARYTNSSSYGGSAYQLPEANAAHIFRKNPSDRASNINSTTKDDYFLEDVYESINTSSRVDRTNGSHITISGIGGEPGTSGNNLLYYIDGNLWIHNQNAYSFTLWNSSGTPIHITFVVKGNIYISDNIFYNQTNQDGLAMIAMKDPSVSDSGNIYFGDPTFGTLEYMDAFMYAENNFYDNNLSASGSARVTVHGNMTAGNQVLINRDYGTQHSKLTVDFDSRIWDQTLALPGLPTSSEGNGAFAVVSWREVAAP
jgi:hypothetical protein